MQDHSKYLEVTAMALETKQYDDMVRYLMMVRDKVKDPKVDTEIVIAYAMTHKLGDLEAFITSAPPSLELN
jgi:clathrin heavy chain